MDITTEGKKLGIQAVVEEGHDPSMAVPGAITGEQAALFPVKMQDDDAPDRSSVKKAGRPAGSKNRSTEQWRDFLFARYRSPLIGLAEIASLSVLELAKMLRFEVEGEFGRKAKPEELLELTKVQIACRDKLAPYLHSKMPLAIQNDGGALINLNIGTMGAAVQQAVEEAGGMIEIIENESQQNQSFSGVDVADSVVSDSVELDKSAENSAFEEAKATDLKSVDNDGGAA
ncbi:MAG: hypothetical protein IAE63_06835 [Alphaproteobacteria bacterium]|nr:hypothetical protein [Alphaproteobacteria bacterium]